MGEAVTGLDQPCGTCGRRSGDHTLDQWAACLGQPTHDLSFQEVPADVQEILRRRYAGLDGYAIGDTVDVRAATLDGTTGNVHVRIPAVLLDFQIGSPQGTVVTAKVAFLGTAEVMRKFGILVRDSANAAVNRAAGR